MLAADSLPNLTTGDGQSSPGSRETRGTAQGVRVEFPAARRRLRAVIPDGILTSETTKGPAHVGHPASQDLNLDDLEGLREGWDFEAKLAAGRDGQGAVPRTLWETYSAMANTKGGFVLLGADERDDGSFDLRGIADIEKVERDLWNTLENPQKVSVNLLSREHVQRLELDSRKFLLIRVPKATRARSSWMARGSAKRFCACTTATVLPTAMSLAACWQTPSPTETPRYSMATASPTSTLIASENIGSSLPSAARIIRSSRKTTVRFCDVSAHWGVIVPVTLTG